MNILIFGGTGFIGTHLSSALVRLGHNVTIFDSKHPAYPNPGISYIVEEFANFIPGGVDALRDADVIIHAISGTRPSENHPHTDISVLAHSVRLLQAVMPARPTRLTSPRFIYLSSSSVYGYSYVTGVSEVHPRKPISSYGIIKAAIEDYTQMYSSMYNFDSLILRLSNVYGPHPHHPNPSGVIPTLFRHASSGTTARLYGDSEAQHDFIHVFDVVDFVVKAINSGMSGVYNVGSGVGTSLVDLLNIVRDTTGRDLSTSWAPARPFDTPGVILDISKATFQAPWTPTRDLRTGCTAYWAWLDHYASSTGPR